MSERNVFDGLPSGWTTTLDYHAIVGSAGSGTATATVSAVGAVQPAPGDASASVTTSYVPSADLLITSVLSPGTMLVGDEFDYTVNFKNAGPSASSTARITTTLPAQLSLVSAPAGCTGSGPIICDTGPLAKDATGTRTLRLHATTTGNATTTSTINGDDTDPNTTNNSGSSMTAVNGPDLTVTSFTVEDFVAIGEDIHLSFTIKNQGAAPTTSRADAVYLSRDQTVDSSDAALMAFHAPVGLAPGQSWSFSETLHWRAEYYSPGQHYLIVRADYSNSIVESDENNNAFARPLTQNSFPVPLPGGPYTVAEGQTIELSATGTDADGDALTYAWDLDNNGSFETAGSTAAYTATADGPRFVVVPLQVCDSHNSCRRAELQIRIENAPPKVQPQADAQVREGSLFTRTVGVSDPGPDAMTATVTYGDGDGTVIPLAVGATSLGLSHVYRDNGTYTVGISVKDDDFGVTTGAFNVTVENAPPVVDAGADQSLAEGDTLTLAAASTDPGPVDTQTFSVDWGDGSSPSHSLDATHVYADNGSYTVTVTATDDDGGVGQDTLLVSVVNAPPTIDAGPDATVPEGSPLVIAPIVGDAGTADTHTFVVDWDDGVGPVPWTGESHSYADNGIHTIKVTVTDDDGATGSDTLVATVANVAPVVNAGADRTVDEGSSTSVAATFTDPGADTHASSIDWGDGTVTTGLQGGHAYRDNGSFAVTVTVRDDDNGVGTATLNVTVRNAAPSLGPLTGPAGTVVIGRPGDFRASFTDAGIADTHTASWNWGDGKTTPGVIASNAVSGSHTYATAGTFLVEVTLEDDDGGRTTANLSLTVVNPTPPTVTATSPPTSTGISILVTPTATFSRAIDVVTITPATFTLTPTAGGSAVGAVVSCNDPCLQATLKPDGQLAPGTSYTARLSTAIKSADGTALANAVTWAFTTTSAPELKLASPTGQNVGTGTDTGPKITAQFTRAMDASTFTTTSFTLWAPNGTQIPAVPAYDAATNTASLVPTLPLSYNTTYTVKLTTSVKSADGVALASVISWTFTTTNAMITKRIDTGASQASTDSAGRAWLADTNFKNGIVESFPAATIAGIGAYDQGIYRNDRSANAAASLWSYNIPIPNGTYDVKLHFVELTKTTATQRVFSVDVVDTPLLAAQAPYDVNSLDVFKEVGKNTALLRTIANVTIADATLTLKSYAGTDYPTIAAIEILPVRP